jgi:hypothetical protein
MSGLGGLRLLLLRLLTTIAHLLLSQMLTPAHALLHRGARL